MDDMIHKKHNGDIPIGANGDYLKCWDGLLNEVWGVLKDTMPNNEFEALKEDQLVWINEKDTAYEKSIERGDFDAKDVLTHTTRNRAYYLIKNYMD